MLELFFHYYIATMREQLTNSRNYSLNGMEDNPMNFYLQRIMPSGAVGVENYTKWCACCLRYHWEITKTENLHQNYYQTLSPCPPLLTVQVDGEGRSMYPGRENSGPVNVDAGYANLVGTADCQISHVITPRVGICHVRRRSAMAVTKYYISYEIVCMPYIIAIVTLHNIAHK